MVVVSKSSKQNNAFKEKLMLLLFFFSRSFKTWLQIHVDHINGAYQGNKLQRGKLSRTKNLKKTKPFSFVLRFSLYVLYLQGTLCSQKNWMNAKSQFMLLNNQVRKTFSCPIPFDNCKSILCWPSYSQCSCRKMHLFQ